MTKLNGKVAIITGAGRLRGIGYSSAIAFAKLGAKVVVTGTGRKQENYPEDEKKVGWKDVESTANKIRELGSESLFFNLDVTDEKQVQYVINEVYKKFNAIDILVNNAAVAIGTDRSPITEVDLNTFQKVVDVKVTGSYLCTKHVIPFIKKNKSGGKIVNIASLSGKKASANNLAYNAANYAMVGMTQSMAKELGPFGINVNAVCPAIVDTQRMDLYGRSDTWEEMSKRSSIGRNGSPEEVGDFVAHLCTEETSWITGQSINMCGGTVMEH